MKKILKNKKGFTLIELLAVIVVLAIIMVIATTQVTSAMKSATEDSFVSSYKSLVKEVKNRLALSDLDYGTKDIVCSINGSTSSTPAVPKCSTLYDISEKDYQLTVSSAESGRTGYDVTLKGIGKFANIDIRDNCPVSGACQVTTATTADKVTVKINISDTGAVTGIY